MKEGWIEYRLDDFAKVTMGLSPKGDSYNNDKKGIGLLNGPTEFGDTFPNCTLFTTDPKRICKTGDLIFCVRGSTTGRMNRADQPYALGRGVCSISGVDDLTTKFLKQLLTLNLPALLQITGGGTFPNLRKEDINGFKFKAPKNYRKIAAILLAYDDLIENNLKRIKLLEEKAQLTYEEWFVRMKFPGHESTPIDEKTGLPEGWAFGSFSDLMELQRGFDLPIQNRVEGSIPVLASTGVIAYHSECKVKGPGVITGRSGTIGQVQYMADNFWPLNTTLWVRKFKQASPCYSVYFLRYMKLERFAGGSAVPSLDRKVVHMQKVKIPDQSLIDKFENDCKAIMSTTKALNNQNQLLKEARDILLPRLMTGMIDVEQLDLSVFEQGDQEQMLMAAEPEAEYR